MPSDRLLEIHDGPFLELGLGIVGQVIQLARRREDRPNRDRLAIRFEHFQNMRGSKGRVILQARDLRSIQRRSSS
jgi:hypothetical protein